MCKFRRFKIGFNVLNNIIKSSLSFQSIISIYDVNYTIITNVYSRFSLVRQFSSHYCEINCTIVDLKSSFTEKRSNKKHLDVFFITEKTISLCS